MRGRPDVARQTTLIVCFADFVQPAEYTIRRHWVGETRRSIVAL
jgi:hypothetical protein